MDNKALKLTWRLQQQKTHFVRTPLPPCHVHFFVNINFNTISELPNSRFKRVISVRKKSGRPYIQVIVGHLFVSVYDKILQTRTNMSQTRPDHTGQDQTRQDQTRQDQTRPEKKIF